MKAEVAFRRNLSPDFFFFFSLKLQARTYISYFPKASPTSAEMLKSNMSTELKNPTIAVQSCTLAQHVTAAIS